MRLRKARCYCTIEKIYMMPKSLQWQILTSMYHHFMADTIVVKMYIATFTLTYQCLHTLASSCVPYPATTTVNLSTHIVRTHSKVRLANYLLLQIHKPTEVLFIMRLRRMSQLLDGLNVHFLQSLKKTTTKKQNSCSNLACKAS